jgi:hypothetical protein
MLKKILTRLLQRYGPWRLIQAALAAAALCMAGAITLTLGAPIHLGAGQIDVGNTVNLTQKEETESTTKLNVPEFGEVAKLMRTGLFKPQIISHRVDRFDNTVKTIMSQLKLMAVLEIKGEPTAYIDVKGTGVTRCRVGMSIPSLFTVLGINVKNKSVELEVIGHRQMLTQ